MSLDRWANFYLTSATVAATLIGLLFVVITLAAERRPGTERGKIGLYLTPTIVQFGTVVVLAGLLLFPTRTPLTVTLCSVAVDLLLPSVAFAALVAGGVWLSRDGDAGLTVIAAGMEILLVLGILNSWAIAVTVVTSPADRDP